MQKFTGSAEEEEKIDEFNMNFLSGWVDLSYTIRFPYIVHLLPIFLVQFNVFHFIIVTDFTICIFIVFHHVLMSNTMA